MLSQPSAFDSGPAEGGQFLAFFRPGADRHGRVLGDAVAQHPRLLALRAVAARPGHRPGARPAARRWRFYSFIGVAVTSATTIIFGKTIWDPVDVLMRFSNPAVLIIAMLALCIATLATNIAANVVIARQRLRPSGAEAGFRFRIGGLITGLIGILMMPWKLRRGPDGLHLHMAGRLQRPAGADRRHHDCGLFCPAPHAAGRAGALRPGRANTATPADGASRRLLALTPRACCRTCPGFSPRSMLGAGNAAPVFLAVYNYAWFVGFALAFAGYLRRVSIWRVPVLRKPKRRITHD